MEKFENKHRKENNNHHSQNTPAESAVQRMAMSETSAEGAQVRDMLYPDGVSGSPSTIKPISKGAKNNHLESDVS